jgi:hypothetical protein
MFKLGDDQQVWTLAIDREGDKLRYRMMSNGIIAWEYKHTLPAIVDELNTRLRDAALLALAEGGAAECLRTLGSIGNVIYSLMVPVEVRERMPPAGSPLLISTSEQNYHYELIHDGEDFWGNKYAVGRQLVGSQPKRKSAKKKQSAACALVIANPSDDLPEAEREASGLVGFLQQSGVECQYMASQQVTSAELMIQLNSDRFDLLHYSGHIGWEEKGDAAFVLSGGQHFKLKDISGLVGFGSPFVFLNGCGGMLEARDVSAGLMYDGVVAPFIYAGACAVVGTRWKVDDASARRFAEAFYGKLLEGETVGAAMAAARAEACGRQDIGAWPAFVLFGNPLLRLTGAKKPEANEEPEKRVHADIPSGPPVPVELSAFLPDGRLNMSAFTSCLRGSLDAAYRFAAGYSLLSTTHWFIGFMLNGGFEARQLFEQFGVRHEQAGGVLAVTLLGQGTQDRVDVARAEQAELSENFIKALNQAADIAGRAGRKSAGCYDVLSAMLDMNCSMGMLLQPLGIEPGKLLSVLGELQNQT